MKQERIYNLTGEGPMILPEGRLKALANVISSAYDAGADGVNFNAEAWAAELVKKLF